MSSPKHFDACALSTRFSELRTEFAEFTELVQKWQEKLREIQIVVHGWEEQQQATQKLTDRADTFVNNVS